MFANRFTAFIDACALAGALRRNLLLTLAEAEFFRVRWSSAVLDETESAILKILEKKGAEDAAERASRARKAMERAFEEALVDDFDQFLCIGADLPDPGDAHVLAAALIIKADTIVTDNLKDFPTAKLESVGLEARSADAVIADTITLKPGRAVAAIRNMRERFKNPALDAEKLLLVKGGAKLGHRAA